MKKQNKILLLIIIASIILIACGMFLYTSSKKDVKTKENDKLIESTEKKENIKSPAEKVLIDLHLDEFMALYFTSWTETNKNLLDLSDVDGISNYLLSNSAIKKYKVLYEKESNPTNLLYIKYNDFIKAVNEVFNALPTFLYRGITIDFSEFKKDSSGNFVGSKENIRECDINGNTNNCYILIGSGELKDVKKQNIVFDNLQMSETIITGEVIKYYDIKEKNSYIKGTFELEYEQNNGQNIIKSLKIMEITEK